MFQAGLEFIYRQTGCPRTPERCSCRQIVCLSLCGRIWVIVTFYIPSPPSQTCNECLLFLVCGKNIDYSLLISEERSHTMQTIKAKQIMHCPHLLRIPAAPLCPWLFKVGRSLRLRPDELKAYGGQTVVHFPIKETCLCAHL